MPSKHILSLRPLLLMLLAAAGLSLVASSSAAATPKMTSVALPAAPSAPAIDANKLREDAGNGNATAYVVGDHLKIAFFEPTFPGDAASQVHAVSSEFVERVEMSGEYIVQDDGCVFLPLLGSVPVAGETPQWVQSRLAALYKGELGRDAKVSIVVTEREPIYILGPVTRPGSYRYAPGMTVMHAIALSEGMEVSNPDFSKAAESIREQERVEKSAQHLQRLLARQAVLIAEQESKQPVAPQRLVELAGEAGAQALMVKTANERHAALAAREALRKPLEATIGAAEKELEILKDRMTHIEVSKKNRVEHFETLNSMQQRGSLSENTMYQARNELSDVEERADGVRLSIAQTEEKLSQARHDKTKLEMDGEIEFGRELTTVENEIAEENLALLSGERLIRAAAGSGQRLVAPDNLSILITRRTASGIQRFAAGVMCPLQAGDLLEIDTVRARAESAADKL